MKKKTDAKRRENGRTAYETEKTIETRKSSEVLDSLVRHGDARAKYFYTRRRGVTVRPSVVSGGRKYVRATGGQSRVQLLTECRATRANNDNDINMTRIIHGRRRRRWSARAKYTRAVKVYTMILVARIKSE